METLKLLLDRSDAVNKYWNIYSVVALGAVAAAPHLNSAGGFYLPHIVLALAFLIFALSNLLAIRAINRQRAELATLVEAPFRRAALLGGPPADATLICFHAALDILVVIALIYAS